MSKNKSKHRNPLDMHPNAYKKRFANAWESAIMNTAEYMFYYDWIMQIACSRFTWENLPVEIDQRFLELALNGSGLTVFFKETKNYNKFFCLRANPNGKINMYDNPTGYTAYGMDGFHKRLSSKECVPIWNSYTRLPTIFAIEIYARRLADIDRTIDINLSGQKYPTFIKCSESQRLTIDNLLKEWKGNEPAVIADALSLEGVEIDYLTSGIPYNVDKLLHDKATIWSEILTYLGIDNCPIEKRERVQAAEVDSNDKAIEKSGLMFLDCRRWACEAINRKYDLEVWVDRSSDFSSENWEMLTQAPAIRYEEKLNEW